MEQIVESEEKPRRQLKGSQWVGAGLSLIIVLALGVRAFLAVAGDGISDTPITSPWSVAFGFAFALTLAVAVLVWWVSTLPHSKKLVVGIVLLVGAVAFFYGEEDLRGRLAWRRFKAQAEAKGERFDFAAIVPPPVPDDQNFALAPLVLSSYGNIIDRYGHRVSSPAPNFPNWLEMPISTRKETPRDGVGSWYKGTKSHLEAWQRYYQELSQTTNLFPVPAQPGNPGADVLLALSVHNETIEELRQAAALPGSRFPLDYDNEAPFSILLPHLAPMKGCMTILQLRVLAELEAGKSDAALADFTLGLQLIEKLRSEPVFITQLTRISMWNMLLQTLWEGLADRRWTDAQLSSLEQRLATLDFAADYRMSMRSENVFQTVTIDYLRNHPQEFKNLFDSNGMPDEVLPLLTHLIPSGWYYQNQFYNSRFILDQLLTVADANRPTFSPSVAAKADNAIEKTPRGVYTILSKYLLPGLANAARKFATAQATMTLARTACALERYRLAEGKFPATLDALAPRFIAELPFDPIGGKPLHYRLTGNGGFILYSVGWNEKDDNGTVVLTKSGADWDKGDIVWRYPEAAKP